MTRLHSELAEIPEGPREKLRAALGELLAEGAGLTAAGLRKRARVQQRSAATVLRLYHAGRLPPLTEPWVEGEKPTGPTLAAQDLARRIRAATSARELADVAREAAAQVAEESLEKSRALVDLLRECRRAIADAAAIPADEEDLPFVPMSAEALPLVEGFERIVNGWRRRWLVEAARLHLEADRAECPRTIQPPGEPSWDPKTFGLDKAGDAPEGAPWPSWLPPPQVPGPWRPDRADGA